MNIRHRGSLAGRRRVVTALGGFGAAAALCLAAVFWAHWPQGPDKAAAGPGRASWPAAGIIYHYLPATGAQYAVGARFSGIYSALQDDIVSACMARSGFKFPRVSAAVYAAQDFDNSQWPDLAAISRSGMLDPGLEHTLPGIAVPHDKARGYQADYARCENEQQRIFAPMTQAGGRLLGQWLAIVSGIEASAPLRDAVAGFAACTERAGTPVSSAGSLNYFLAWVTGREAMAPTQAAAIAVDKRWAAVFVRCAGPAVALQDRMELERQAAFLTGHRQQVLGLVSIASRLTGELERQYGCRAACRAL
jgi:hypothetical protein